VEESIESVGLVEKTDVPAGLLSGGMKRKLCLGMALIGKSVALLPSFSILKNYLYIYTYIACALKTLYHVHLFLLM
jgi:hypothetical protein